MSRLDWGAVGERFYETGVDRGVLYVGSGPGVPWTGLISVSEVPKGGESKPYYIDGIKYMNRSAPEEFEADIEAYTYPDEFSQCDGTLTFAYGLSATQGRRKEFNLAYRSRVGNDLEGVDHGYKIHLVYGALAEPTEQTHQTISDDSEAFNFTWHITTRPPLHTERRPMSHFIIDSRRTPPDLLALIEGILYGTDEDDSRMPVIDELFYHFNSYMTSLFYAGDPDQPYYVTFDGGIVPAAQTSTINGGAP